MTRKFRLTLCNEVIAGRPFDKQCAFAAGLGYDGLEVAPMTLSDNPANLSVKQRADHACAARDAGIAITGLHWLLNAPEGLSITSDDPVIKQRTHDHIRAMIDLCVDLGGGIIVHGSPAQRPLSHAATPERAMANVTEALRVAAVTASAAGITYCIEPLSPRLTDCITSIDAALKIVAEIDNPALSTMLDTLAAWGGGDDAPDQIIKRYVPDGRIRHIHLNDDNARAPGQGQRQFTPVIRALVQTGYAGLIGVEPFDYHPDGSAAASRAIGYIQGICEALEV